MTNHRFVELLAMKLSNEISEEDDKYFQFMIETSEDHRLEYECFREYFNYRSGPEGGANSALFTRVMDRIRSGDADGT